MRPAHHPETCGIKAMSELLVYESPDGAMMEPTAPTTDYIWSYINRSVYCYRKQAWIGHTWLAIGTQWSQLGPAATLNDSADAIRYKMATLIACFPSDVESAPFPIVVSNSIGNGNWKHPLPRPRAVETSRFHS